MAWLKFGVRGYLISWYRNWSSAESKRIILGLEKGASRISASDDMVISVATDDPMPSRQRCEKSLKMCSCNRTYSRLQLQANKTHKQITPKVHTRGFNTCPLLMAKSVLAPMSAFLTQRYFHNRNCNIFTSTVTRCFSFELFIFEIIDHFK